MTIIYQISAKLASKSTLNDIFFWNLSLLLEMEYGIGVHKYHFNLFEDDIS